MAKSATAQIEALRAQIEKLEAQAREEAVADWETEKEKVSTALGKLNDLADAAGKRKMRLVSEEALSTGGGKRSRMTKADKEALVARARDWLSSQKKPVAMAEIADGLGVEKTQAAQAIKALGKEVDPKGSRRNMTYSLK